MPLTKIVNGVQLDLTPEEEAQVYAERDAYDLEIDRVRPQRNGLLSASDFTQLGDAVLGDYTAEDWQAYRQLLRDIPQNYSRVSEIVWPLDPPAEAARLAALDDE